MMMSQVVVHKVKDRMMMISHGSDRCVQGSAQGGSVSMEEQVMYVRLEQLEQEKLDYDLRMYEQKQRLRVDLVHQSKVDNCHDDVKKSAWW